MVDRSARNILAELIHQFVAGRIENFDFENRVPESEDFTIREIWWCGCWPLYDDFRTHRMVGTWRIPDESRHEIAKWILFLHSDYEYEWKPRTWPGNPGGSLLRLLTFGSFPKFPYAFRTGKESVWPFISKSQFEAARRHPRYINSGS
jgi:hypothetical protein